MFQGSVGRRPRAQVGRGRSATARRTAGGRRFRDADAARTTGRTEAMRLALFEPDIPQNLGAFIRLSACLKVPLDVIEPCGFPVDDKRIRRAAMDYYDLASIARHASWAAFKRARELEHPVGRLVLLTTK